MSTKDVQKTLCFHETKCNHGDDIDQDTRASSASRFKEQGMNRKPSVQNKFPSKIKRWKWDDDYIRYEFFLPRPEV